jgi:hypothetical protein
MQTIFSFLFKTLNNTIKTRGTEFSPKTLFEKRSTFSGVRFLIAGKFKEKEYVYKRNNYLHCCATFFASFLSLLTWLFACLYSKVHFRWSLSTFILWWKFCGNRPSDIMCQYKYVLMKSSWELTHYRFLIKMPHKKNQKILYVYARFELESRRWTADASANSAMSLLSTFL